jgi:predicted Zn-dependent protease with MMP-like domain
MFCVERIRMHCVYSQDCAPLKMGEMILGRYYGRYYARRSQETQGQHCDRVTRLGLLLFPHSSCLV